MLSDRDATPVGGVRDVHVIAGDRGWSPPVLALADATAVDVALASLMASFPDEPEPLLAIASGESAFAAVLQRFNGPLTVSAEKTTVGEAIASAAAAGWGSVDTVDLAVATRGSHGAGFRRALWMSPDPDSWRTSAERLDSALAAGAFVAIVGGGPLSAMRRRTGSDASLFDRAADPFMIVRTLRYETVAEWHVYGLYSVWWALLRRAASALGRPHLSDRFEAGYRVAMLRGDASGPWSIGVCVGRKPVK
jgi:hypothetical protein